MLSEIKKHPLYDETMLLTEMGCLVVSKIRNKILHWQNLLTWRCVDLDSSKLNQAPFCTHCNFMKVQGRDYSSIKSEIKNMDTTLDTILQEYQQNAISEISKNIGNLALIAISPNHKILIKSIAETKQLHGNLDKALIASINELFKNFKILELSRDQVIEALFKDDQLLTLDQLRQAFLNFEIALKGSGNEDEIRIKLS